MTELEGLQVDWPTPVGLLKINESMSVAIYKKMPSRFHRWMAKVLLGWEYTEVKDD